MWAAAPIEEGVLRRICGLVVEDALTVEDLQEVRVTFDRLRTSYPVVAGAIQRQDLIHRQIV